MTAHLATHYKEAEAKHYATCSCKKFRTPTVRTRHDAEDAYAKHIEMVERARLHLGTKTPSLKHQRDYYREQANDMNLPVQERALWQQLAGELDARLNESGKTNSDQPGLW